MNANLDQPRRRIRWPIAAVILAAAVVAQLILWRLRAHDRTLQIMSIYFVWPAAVFALLIWWTFLSGFSRRARWTGFGIVAVAVVLFFSVVRLEGWSGLMVPQFTWRWAPTREQQARSFWEQSAAKPVLPVEKAELPPLEVSPDDWPEFLGPHRDAVVQGVTLQTDWQKQPPNLLWKHPVGPAWSSFAVVDGLAWTQEQRGEDEAIVCYELATGKELWAHTDPGRFSKELGGTGPRATPTFHDSRLYVLGADGLLNCLDARTGEAHWHTNILSDADAENIMWGMAGSPLVVDDLVVVIPGGKGKSVVAYDRHTGKLVWGNGDNPAGYASPQLATLHGARQILVFDAVGLSGHAVEDGRQLWHFPWTNSETINVAQPLVLDDETVLVSSGYGKGSARLKLTPQDDGEWGVEPLWTTRDLKLKFNGAVVKDGYVYGLDEGILACIDVQTGKRPWKNGRYGFGQLLLVGDVLLVQAESGEVALVEASPQRYRELTRMPALDGKTWNCPVIADGKLLVRNSGEAACYDLRSE